MLKRTFLGIGFLIILLFAVIFITGGSKRSDTSEESSSVNSNSNVDQIVNGFISEGSEAQSVVSEEDDEVSQVFLDSDAINNLIQTYDENEF